MYRFLQQAKYMNNLLNPVKILYILHTAEDFLLNGHPWTENEVLIKLEPKYRDLNGIIKYVEIYPVILYTVYLKYLLIKNIPAL